MPPTRSKKLTPQEWESLFRDAHLRVEELNGCRSNRSRSIFIGKFLSSLVNRELPVTIKGRTGRAVLRVEEGRSNSRRYFVEYFWDPPAEDTQEEAATSDPLPVVKQPQPPLPEQPPRIPQRKVPLPATPTNPTKARPPAKPPARTAKRPDNGNTEEWS
jgi:hypothetical protein